MASRKARRVGTGHPQHVAGFVGGRRGARPRGPGIGRAAAREDRDPIPGIGRAGELAEDLGYLAPLKLKWVGNTISGPQDIQAVVTGDIDIGGAFYGAILKLIAAKAPVKAVVGYYGSDANTYCAYFVKDDSPIKTAHDLIGRNVAVNTLGAHLEFVLREYLARSGLSAGEARQVTLVAIPPVSGEQALRQGQVEVSALGGVLRDKALERGGIRSLFVDTDLFGQFTGGAYVLRDKFIKDNTNASRKLVQGISRAIEWAQTTPPEEVRARFDKIIAERKRNEDASSIKYWKSTGVASKGGLISDSEIQVWIDWLVKDGLFKPGQVKASDTYTNAFNYFRPGKTAEAR
ncbi:ABC transporter substrate-binding protein [Bradyrhizobium sp. WU425]|uniref:ABC transporter substrate-binding protein n=1 Tax=Bradyrhizobium sp. WU425 TaxID=187029 RepID=UPI002E166E8D